MRRFRGQIRREKINRINEKEQDADILPGDRSRECSGSGSRMHSERTDEYGNGDEWETPVQGARKGEADAVFFKRAGVSDGADGAHWRSWDWEKADSRENSVSFSG